jgi:hypothetical protein
MLSVRDLDSGHEVEHPPVAGCVGRHVSRETDERPIPADSLHQSRYTCSEATREPPIRDTYSTATRHTIHDRPTRYGTRTANDTAQPSPPGATAASQKLAPPTSNSDRTDRRDNRTTSFGGRAGSLSERRARTAGPPAARYGGIGVLPSLPGCVPGTWRTGGARRTTTRHTSTERPSQRLRRNDGQANPETHSHGGRGTRLMRTVLATYH